MPPPGCARYCNTHLTPLMFDGHAKCSVSMSSPVSARAKSSRVSRLGPRVAALTLSLTLLLDLCSLTHSLALPILLLLTGSLTGSRSLACCSLPRTQSRSLAHSLSHSNHHVLSIIPGPNEGALTLHLHQDTPLYSLIFQKYGQDP